MASSITRTWHHRWRSHTNTRGPLWEKIVSSRSHKRSLANWNTSTWSCKRIKTDRGSVISKGDDTGRSPPTSPTTTKFVDFDKHLEEQKQQRNKKGKFNVFSRSFRNLPLKPPPESEESTWPSQFILPSFHPRSSSIFNELLRILPTAACRTRRIFLVPTYKGF